MNLLRVLCIILLMLGTTTLAWSQEKPVNVLFIKTDDQAAWSLGCYGNTESKTPTLDRLAAEGAKFSNAFVVTPVCSPSRATFMTGLHSTQVQIKDWITPEQARNGLGLNTDLPTWTKLLHANGYRTGLVGKWHLGNQSKFHPRQNGFDFFSGHLDGGWAPQEPVLEIEGKPTKIEGFSVDRMAEEAIRFLSLSDSKPFALCVHFREPHTPYVPVPAPDAAVFASLNPTIPNYPQLKVNQVKTWTRQYYASIHSIDRNVARILHKLDELKLSRNTLVIFTSDHGYNIGHHGIHTKGNGNWCTTDKTGVRPNMWDTSLRIPLLIRWPGVVKPGTVYDQWITNQDFFPSLLALAGISIPGNYQGDRRNFLPLLRGQPYSARDVLFGQYDISNTADQQMRMIRTRDWKLVRHYSKRSMDEMFDLRTDPDELKNVIDQQEHHAVRDALQQRLETWMRSINDPVLTSK